MSDAVDARAVVARVEGWRKGGGATLAATGGLLGALGAASCCMLPLALFMAGVGGAWIGALTTLEPYQPIFVAVALGFLGYGYWLVHRRRKAACADGEACARTGPSLFLRASLYTATVLVAAAVAFPHVAPLFLGV